MTVKRSFFKINGLIFLMTILSVVSCKNLKPTSNTAPVLEFDTIFFGYSNEGTHSRAIDISGNYVGVAGKGGQVTVMTLDTVSPEVLKTKSFEGFEDFRDMEFVAGGAALFMNSGENGLIYGVAPGGGGGQIVFDTSGVFLDGLDFWESDQNYGIVYGDPIGGRFFLARTENMGRNWNALTPNQMPKALPNEAGFAASGSGIQTIGDSTVYFGTGNASKARLFKSEDKGNNWTVFETPMKAGEGFGIYSLYFWSENEGVVIGGSYLDSTYKDKICFYTNDGGENWENRSEGLGGYCSIITSANDGGITIASGRMGTYYSVDKGNNWHRLTNRGYYTCMIQDNMVFLSGKNGAYAVFKYK